MNLPKHMRDSVKRLRAADPAGWQEFLRHLDGQVASTALLMADAPTDGVHIMQGKVQALKALHKALSQAHLDLPSQGKS